MKPWWSEGLTETYSYWQSIGYPSPSSFLSRHFVFCSSSIARRSSFQAQYEDGPLTCQVLKRGTWNLCGGRTRDPTFSKSKVPHDELRNEGTLPISKMDKRCIPWTIFAYLRLSWTPPLLLFLFPIIPVINELNSFLFFHCGHGFCCSLNIKWWGDPLVWLKSVVTSFILMEKPLQGPSLTPQIDLILSSQCSRPFYSFSFSYYSYAKSFRRIWGTSSFLPVTTCNFQ